MNDQIANANEIHRIFYIVEGYLERHFEPLYFKHLSRAEESFEASKRHIISRGYVTAAPYGFADITLGKDLSVRKEIFQGPPRTFANGEPTMGIAPQAWLVIKRAHFS